MSSSRPIICIFGYSLEAGGAERQFAQLAVRLGALGHQVLFLTLHEGGQLEALLRDAPNVIVHSLRKAGWWDLRSFWRLIRVMRQYRPVLVYSFLTRPNIIAALFRAVGLLPPLVWGIRGLTDVGRWPGMAGRFVRWCVRRLSVVPSLVITNSTKTFKNLLDAGYREERLAVVPNGIDADRFEFSPQLRTDWRARNHLEKFRVVGLLARHDPAKDFPTLLRAFSLVHRDHPDTVLVFAGSDPWGLAPGHRLLAEELGLGDAVRWLPPEIDSRAFLSGIDLFCLSSISEGFPNVLGEALISGLPVVTTDAGESRLVVQEHGIVVPCSDHLKLAHGITEALSLSRDPARGNHIRQEFSLESCAQKTLACLGKVAALHS